MRRLSRAISLFVFSMTVFLTASCASNAPVALPESGTTVSGTVTYNGKPVHFALIIVQAVNGGAVANGSIQPDGKYEVKNAPVGEVKVAVNTDAGKGELITAQMQGGMYTGPDGKKAKRVSIDYNQVPKKFQSPETTTITTTLNKGDNTFDIVVPTK
jgi:hypothetical protein